MKTFDELVDFGIKYGKMRYEREFHSRASFMKYVQKTILLILKKDEKEIVSFLKQIASNTMVLVWAENGCEFGCYISINKSDELYIPKFEFSNAAFKRTLSIKPDDPLENDVSALSNEECALLLNYFSNYTLNSLDIVSNVVDSFNKELFSNFKNMFENIDITENSFSSSIYALQIPSKTTNNELYKDISNFYSEHLNVVRKYESDFENCRRTITYYN